MAVRPVDQMIQYPNMLATAIDARRAGQQDRAYSLAQDDRASLRSLAPRVLSGEPGAFEEAAAINPEAAGQYQEAGDSQIRRLKGFVSYVDQARASGNMQAVNAALQQGAPFISRILGKPGPTEWTPEMEPGWEALKAKIAMADSTGQSGSVQSRFIGKDGQVYALMRDGGVRPLGIEADPNVQVVEGAGGFYTIDKRGGAAAPVQLGGAPAAAPAQPAGPVMSQVAYATEDGAPIPPEEQQFAQQAFAAASRGEQFDVPVGGALPQTRPPASAQGQLQGKPSADQESFGQPQQVVGPDGQKRFVQFGNRGGLREVPGSMAPAPTAGEGFDNEGKLRKELSDRLKGSREVLTMYRNLESAARAPSAANDLSLIFAYMKMLDPGSVVREQEFANAQNAAGVPDQVVNWYNRLLRGERLNDGQRATFLASARQLANNAQSQLTATTREYQGIAEQNELDPQRATGMADFRGVTSAPEGGAAPAQAQGTNKRLRFNPATGRLE